MLLEQEAELGVEVVAEAAHQVVAERAHHADDVDAVVLVETMVLDRDVGRERVPAPLAGAVTLGQKVEALERREIEEVNARLAPFRVFAGIESDILPDGSLDYPAEVLAELAGLQESATGERMKQTLAQVRRGYDSHIAAVRTSGSSV